MVRYRKKRRRNKTKTIGGKEEALALHRKAQRDGEEMESVSHQSLTPDTRVRQVVAVEPIYILYTYYIHIIYIYIYLLIYIYQNVYNCEIILLVKIVQNLVDYKTKRVSREVSGLIRSELSLRFGYFLSSFELL